MRKGYGQQQPARATDQGAPQGVNAVVYPTTQQPQVKVEARYLLHEGKSVTDPRSCVVDCTTNDFTRSNWSQPVNLQFQDNLGPRSVVSQNYLKYESETEEEEDSDYEYDQSEKSELVNDILEGACAQMEDDGVDEDWSTLLDGLEPHPGYTNNFGQPEILYVSSGGGKQIDVWDSKLNPRDYIDE